MKIDDENVNESVRDKLYTLLDEAESLNALVELLQQLEIQAGACNPDLVAELACEALTRVLSLTTDDPQRASNIILTHLLPRCLQTDATSRAPSSTRFDGYRFRELLKKWIYSYPQKPMTELRDRILEDIFDRLGNAPTKEALWVVAAIGYASSKIQNAILLLLNSSDELSDTALGTLAGLGLEREKCELLLTFTMNRISSGSLTRGILITVDNLVGPYRVEMAIDLLNLASTKYPTEEHGDFALAVSTATRALDRCDGDAPAHDEIWGILRKHFKTVNTSSEYGNRCNTKATVVDYVEWLMTKEIGGGGDTGVYIMLSRLSGLTKPNQLTGWDEINRTELSAFLRQFATKDTKITGRFATTQMHLKREVWETILTIAYPHVEDWIDAAVMDETNPYAVHEIAEIIACLKIHRLPDRLLNELREVGISEDDNSRFFRQAGLTQIARSSCSREAFLALLRFGISMNEDVLLATIDAITDVAITRIREGDTDVVERVLEMTSPVQKKRHRNAAISVFCRLCIQGLVREDYYWQLLNFVNTDEDIYARCAAMEAIALTQATFFDRWRGWINSIARIDQSDLGWRACEVIIRRNWIAPDDEPWLFSRLHLSSDKSEVHVINPVTLNGWIGFLIGLLYRTSKDRFSDAMSDVIESAPLDVVYQSLDSVKYHASCCPDSVSAALVNRILSTNKHASTVTEFFRVLAAVSPSKLLMLSSNVANWANWMVEARAVLCESIRTVAMETNDDRDDAVECLTHFMRDASFQVRRSAYRAIASLDADRLNSICRDWGQSPDIELRKRAAEASTWLPLELYSDDTVSELAFGFDPERVVRDIWKNALPERRQRFWATAYVSRVLAACGDGTVSLNYRFGRALAKIGDDDCLRLIEAFVSTHQLRPNVSHWLEKTCSEIKENWKEKTSRWAEPWSHEHGSIEELDGEITVGDESRLDARFSLWCHYQSGPSEHSEWGGIAEFGNGAGFWALSEGPIRIQIPNRPVATANIRSCRASSSSRSFFTFHGIDSYPASRQTQEPINEMSTADVVLQIIHQSGVTLTTSAPIESATQTLQTVLAEAEFVFEWKIDPGTRKEAAFRVAAKVTQRIATVLPSSYPSSIALWRIADSFLKRAGMCLRLSPVEVEIFGALATCDGKELFLWMKQRVQSIRSERNRSRSQKSTKRSRKRP